MSTEKINEADFWKARFEHANSMHESCMKTLETLMSKVKPNREWVNLMDEEILQCYSAITKQAWDYIGFARAVEAKIKEKNHGTRQYKDLCGND